MLHLMTDLDTIASLFFLFFRFYNDAYCVQI